MDCPGVVSALPVLIALPLILNYASIGPQTVRNYTASLTENQHSFNGSFGVNLLTIYVFPAVMDELPALPGLGLVSV